MRNNFYQVSSILLIFIFISCISTAPAGGNINATYTNSSLALKFLRPYAAFINVTVKKSRPIIKSLDIVLRNLKVSFDTKYFEDVIDETEKLDTSTPGNFISTLIKVLAKSETLVNYVSSSYSQILPSIDITNASSFDTALSESYRLFDLALNFTSGTIVAMKREFPILHNALVTDIKDSICDSNFSSILGSQNCQNIYIEDTSELLDIFDLDFINTTPDDLVNSIANNITIIQSRLGAIPPLTNDLNNMLLGYLHGILDASSAISRELELLFIEQFIPDITVSESIINAGHLKDFLKQLVRSSYRLNKYLRQLKANDPKELNAFIAAVKDMQYDPFNSEASRALSQATLNVNFLSKENFITTLSLFREIALWVIDMVIYSKTKIPSFYMQIVQIPFEFTKCFISGDRKCQNGHKLLGRVEALFLALEGINTLPDSLIVSSPSTSNFVYEKDWEYLNQTLNIQKSLGLVDHIFKASSASLSDYKMISNGFNLSPRVLFYSILTIPIIFFI